MKSYETFREELLRDPEVKREYEAQKAEFEIVRALIELRVKARLRQPQMSSPGKPDDDNNSILSSFS